jgi:hypothetical protein
MLLAPLAPLVLILEFVLGFVLVFVLGFVLGLGHRAEHAFRQSRPGFSGSTLVLVSNRGSPVSRL